MLQTFLIYLQLPVTNPGKLYTIQGHSKLIFSFWSYPSFLHDAGGRVIKTIGLR